MHDERTLKWFDRMGIARPSHDPHGTPEDLIANMKRVKAHNWRMEGNKLIADTDMGPLVQFMPTDVICHGTGDDGMPLLTRIKV